ncbi:OmpP1/FadL family transporter [Marinobacter lutaoensis]|uniref:OmpP1/FadL family transporter n=1 Tax=Marinobacter lutaoensis TaxID=135739 RepID=UPI0020CBE201|nr:outer membrane protein transport protein [Marinobacter lutaoensis]
MHKKIPALATAVRVATLAAVAAPSLALAGGFSLNEQCACAMGVANAGMAANAENATTVLFNPAGMSQLSGTNVSFGAAYLDIDAEAKSGTYSATDSLGQPYYGSGGGDIADPALLPNIYITHEVSDSIDVGFGIHAPYGLAADYDNDFTGRYFADKTELTVISFTPALAVNNGKGLSMGVALNIMYAEGRLSKYQDLRGLAVRQQLQRLGVSSLNDLSPAQQGQVVGAANSLADNFDTYADVEGDDIGVTLRVGFQYDLSSATRIGLTAQTGTELDLKGDMEITQFPVATGNPAAQYTAATLEEDVRVPLAIPESITVGVRHRLNESVTLLAGATYARWGNFKELDIFSREGDRGTISSAVGRTGDENPITHITEEWKNTWQFNVGAVWQLNPVWALKAGYAFDESPVDQYVTPGSRPRTGTG